MNDAGDILVLNAGSSSIKFAVFDSELNAKCSGIAAEIGAGGFVEVDGSRKAQPLIDHRAALQAVLSALHARGIGPDRLRAAAHRVVHGGRKLSQRRCLVAAASAPPQHRTTGCRAHAPMGQPCRPGGSEAMSSRGP